jgi:hypothetical protein
MAQAPRPVSPPAVGTPGPDPGILRLVHYACPKRVGWWSTAIAPGEEHTGINSGKRGLDYLGRVIE